MSFSINLLIGIPIQKASNSNLIIILFWLFLLLSNKKIAVFKKNSQSIIKSWLWFLINLIKNVIEHNMMLKRSIQVEPTAIYNVKHNFCISDVDVWETILQPCDDDWKIDELELCKFRHESTVTDFCLEFGEILWGFFSFILSVELVNDVCFYIFVEFRDVK